jgi:hypothetical protein
MVIKFLASVIGSQLQVPFVPLQMLIRQTFILQITCTPLIPMDIESVEEESKLAAGSLVQTAVMDFKDIYKSLNQTKLLRLMKICQNKYCIKV